MLCVAGALAPASRAAAADQLVSITIASITPSATDGTGTLTISGTVTNTSGVSMTSVVAQIWSSQAPISSPEGLREALAKAPEDPIGARLQSDADGNLSPIAINGQQFAPGQTASFSVRATVSRKGGTRHPPLLSSPHAGSVYLVGVHVRAVPQGQGTQTVGRARAFLPVVNAATSATRTSIVVLTSHPAELPNGMFADDHLATEFGGRLKQLLDAASRSGVTALVDPELVAEAQAMAVSYLVESGSETVKGTGSAVAVAWLSELAGLLQTGDVYRLPWGNPDLGLAASTGDTDILLRAAAQMSASNPIARQPLAILPPDGVLTDALTSMITAAKPAIVLVSNATNQNSLLSDGSLLVASYDATAFAGGPSPDPRATTAQVTGRLLAETLLASKAGDSPIVLVTTAAQAALDADTPGWLHRRTLSQLRSRGSPQVLDLTPTTLPQPDARWLAALTAAHRDLAAWGDLTGKTSDAQDRLAAVLALASSRDWAQDPAAVAAFVAKATADANGLLSTGRLTLHVSKNFVMGERTQAMPLTISNSLNSAVNVKVSFTSENSQRMSIPATAVVEVPAGESVTVMFNPVATANGAVAFSARLLTATNRAIGSPASFSITATQFGRVGWLIIAASGVVFLAITSLRIRQVQREGAKRRVEADRAA